MKRDFSVRSLILAIIIVFSIERTYAEEEFDQWIEAFRKEALKKYKPRDVRCEQVLHADR